MNIIEFVFFLQNLAFFIQTTFFHRKWPQSSSLTSLFTLIFGLMVMVGWWLINEWWRIYKFITCIWFVDSWFNEAAEFHLCSHGELPNFIWVATVSHRIYQIFHGTCQILLRKTVGSSHMFITAMRFVVPHVWINEDMMNDLHVGPCASQHAKVISLWPFIIIRMSEIN